MGVQVKINEISLGFLTIEKLTAKELFEMLLEELRHKEKSKNS